MFSQASVWLLIIMAMMASLMPDIAIAALSNFLEKRSVLLKYEKIKKEKRSENVYVDAGGNDFEMTKSVSPTGGGRRRSINRNNNNNNNATTDYNNNISQTQAPGTSGHQQQQQSYVNKTFVFDDLNRIEATKTNSGSGAVVDDYANRGLDYQKTESYVSVRF
jgi:hypothetical protein